MILELWDTSFLYRLQNKSSPAICLSIQKVKLLNTCQNVDESECSLHFIAQTNPDINYMLRPSTNPNFIFGLIKTASLFLLIDLLKLNAIIWCYKLNSHYITVRPKILFEKRQTIPWLKVYRKCFLLYELLKHV